MVESRACGLGTVDSLDFGSRSPPGQSPTTHQDQTHPPRSDLTRSHTSGISSSEVSMSPLSEGDGPSPLHWRGCCSLTAVKLGVDAGIWPGMVNLR
jgi:hypothetical protein